jgi:hypothetical protein
MKYGRLPWSYPAWWLDITFAAAVSASISLFTSTGRAGLFIEQMHHAICAAGPANIAFIPHTENGESVQSKAAAGVCGVEGNADRRRHFS